MYVQGVTEVPVNSVEQALNLFRTGLKTRQTGSTKLNAQSSRSHMALTIRLVQRDAKVSCKPIESQLTLVDLAGSERSKRTENSGQRLREAANINNSLSTLRKCLSTMRKNQQSHTRQIIPYRENPLTLLFKNHFEGDSNVGIIVCVSQQADQYEETRDVLGFATMAQDVKMPRRPPSPPVTIESVVKVTSRAPPQQHTKPPHGTELELGRVRRLTQLHELLIGKETQKVQQSNCCKTRGGGDAPQIILVDEENPMVSFEAPNQRPFKRRVRHSTAQASV
ncbi:kinesin-like protein KIF23 [Anopheles albimanus]|uniref:kinesin-like protein KIF23 n=1 Tax=Anopheles albimanus TaxID=7167 RepID=UPI00164226FA|nr:kinesin-like protein KIF23 [Anopheles albimanus]